MRYGYEFVHETYLYHFIRKDHRHNFSPYFYGVYLSFMNASTAFWTKRFAFLPQLILIVYYGLKYALKDLSMALFCQTFAFVMMNKVSTSQVRLFWFIF
jgi:phosphatidylinositol glycan class M